jgi:hypothetical protein
LPVTIAARYLPSALKRTDRTLPLWSNLKAHINVTSNVAVAMASRSADQREGLDAVSGVVTLLEVVVVSDLEADPGGLLASTMSTGGNVLDKLVGRDNGLEQRRSKTFERFY